MCIKAHQMYKCSPIVVFYVLSMPTHSAKKKQPNHKTEVVKTFGH